MHSNRVTIIICCAILLAHIVNIVNSAQLRILAGDNSSPQPYTTIIGIDTTTSSYTVIREKIPLWTGGMMMLGTSGKLKGIDCFILPVRNGTSLTIQYFRISDGVMIYKSPPINLLFEYDSITADDTRESHILVQGYVGSRGNFMYSVNTTSGEYTLLNNIYAPPDNGQFSYYHHPYVYSTARTLEYAFYYDVESTYSVNKILELNQPITARHPTDIYGKNGEAYVLTYPTLYKCSVAPTSVCSIFTNTSVDLFDRTHQVAKGITADDDMENIYFVGDPQTLYTLGVTSRNINAHMSLRNLYLNYPELKDLRVYKP